MSFSPPLLSIRDLEHRRSGPPDGFAVRLTDLDLRPGDRLALVGPSGSGKSTLLDIISLALRPDRAARFTVSLSGPVEALALWRAGQGDRLAALRGAAMGYVLQTGGLLPFLSVRRNILLGGRVSGRADPAHAEALAARLGIDHLLDRMPGQLSVGERQRVGIARALAHRPRILFADEPTASVDPNTAETVMELMMEAAEREGVATIVASHDHDLIDRYGLDRIGLEITRDETGTVSVFGGGVAVKETEG